MKKLNKKGFTLIELLAVITIMGILMLVAIPAISRTIENSRRDTFMNTAQTYISSARNMWLSDSFACGNYRTGSNSNGTVPSALNNGNYYILIKSSETSNPAITELLQQGGKSSWGSLDVSGIIQVNVSGSNASTGSTGSSKAKFAIALTDGTHGIKSLTAEEQLKRKSVMTSSAAQTFTDVSLSQSPATISGIVSESTLGKGFASSNVTSSEILGHLCIES